MIFLGILFSKEYEEEILKWSNTGLSNATNTFQLNLIDGLNKISTVDIINVLPVGVFPFQYKKLLLMTKKWGEENNKKNIQIGSINLPIIKQLIRYKKIKNEINLRIKKTDNVGTIVIYSTYLPFLKAVKKLNKNTNIVLIVTDLPEYYDLNKVNKIRQVLRKINNNMIYNCLSRVDSFVLLTEQMKIPLNVGNRPYVVIEGMVNVNDLDLNTNYNINTHMITDKKVILYTGTLHYQFGIRNLLKAFELIEDSEYELWICGSGEAENEIRELAHKDRRIKFYGYVTKTEVNKLQRQATILINPRQNEGEYTKYSFPSKTLEYMLSGKPVLMYKLDGIPNEYDEYLYYINDITIEGLKESIINICSKPKDELRKFGAKAQDFVIKEKNNIVQAKRIIDLISTKENETMTRSYLFSPLI